MNTRNNDNTNNTLSLQEIKYSDTLSQLVEKCNDNFSKIVSNNGGPVGAEGGKGEQGVPTKPKVPIHVWRIGEEYNSEQESLDEGFIIDDWNEDLTKSKYQEGHLILLETARVYMLKMDNYILKPKYMFTLQSYTPGEVIDGKKAYVHVAYANSSDGSTDFITAQELRGESYETKQSTTFNLRRDATNNNSNVNDRIYLGIYSGYSEIAPTHHNLYSWVKIRGNDGIQGEQGPKGERGDGYTGHQFTIDLEGDMSNISINIDRTCYNKDEYCKCILHSYYGNDNIKLNISDVTIILPEEYKYSGENIVLKSNENNKVGKIEKTQNGNDVAIKFIPDENFVFPKKTIIFKLHIETSIDDTNNGNTYDFFRDAIWMVKGVISTFELEIQPQYRTIKLFENGKYYPEKLLVNVYKVEDTERTLFDFSQNTNFTLLYKNINDNEWSIYPNDGVSTNEVSCLEFKVVRYYNSTDPEKPEEMWDYEDVWVVADGKGTHYYHADLGSTESIMILTTGEKINIGTEETPIYCADIKNESGYSITFDPKFYDGTEEISVTSISIGSNSGEEFYTNGTFVRNFDANTLTITRVPYGIDVIPMTFVVTADCPIYDENGDVKEYVTKSDNVSFNVYISTLSNIYILVPTVSSYNTSTGKTGDTIGCSVYKNNTIIPTDELDRNALKLEYVVHDGGTDVDNIMTYTEPLVYGDDDDIKEDEFTAKDVAIEFILSYRNKEIVRSTVPLVKDGIDGIDGDSWQYIFCRSPKYPFGETGISDPSTWVDNKPKDSNNELLGNNGEADGNWYSDSKGIDSEYKYEYQSYRKWNKDKKEWDKYGSPTLHSNYSESGSGYSVLLSNPVTVIPVGNDWSVDENQTNQSDFTLVYLYNNTSNISSNNVSISLPQDNIYVQKGNFTLDKDNNGVNKVVFNPVVGDSIFDFESNTQYKLPITIYYNLGEDIDNDGIEDKFVTTINWSLTPIKGLYDVEVFVDKRVVNTSTSKIHSIRVGYYLTSSDGIRNLIENDKNDNGYKIILTDDISDLSFGAISNWQNASYNFVDNNGKNRNCYVVLVESDESTIIDYVNITAVNDGKSAIHLELVQDHISLPSSVDGGSVHPDYNDNEHPIRSRMMLYDGDKLIEDYDNISYTFKINNEDVDKAIFSFDSIGGFDVPKELINGDTNIECIATYNGTNFNKTLSIDLTETPYELELNKNTLSRDVNIGKITDSSIVARVKYWMNGNWIYTSEGVVKVSTINGIENLSFGNAIGDKCERTLLIEGSYLESDKLDTEVRISYYKDNNSTNELSYETIGIINTGKNGSAPSCINVKILGYSVNESEDINSSNWKASIDELGSLNVGQAIYILNEYTWSDNNVTKGITVTLAGTQGPEGKSRVLFYLGSFEGATPTLSGTTVTGVLSDERCDYYIDKNGNAWMRSGSSGDAIGSSAGNQNDPNWKASEKVGFLQAGAITADMINTGSITANSAIVTKLFSEEITTNNLKVTNANIDGQLEASKIKVEDIKITNANIDGQLEASKIKVEDIKIDAAQITGTLSANKIDSGTLDANKVTIKNLSIGEGVKIGSDFKISGSSLKCDKYNTAQKIISSTILDPDSIELIRYKYMADVVGSDNNPVTTTHHLQSNGLRLEYLPIGSAADNCLIIGNAKDSSGNELSYSGWWGSADIYKNRTAPITVNALSPYNGISIEAIGAIRGTHAHRYASDTSFTDNTTSTISPEYSWYTVYGGSISLNVQSNLYNMEFKINPCGADATLNISNHKNITVGKQFYTSSTTSITLNDGKLYTVFIDPAKNVWIFYQ